MRNIALIVCLWLLSTGLAMAQKFYPGTLEYANGKTEEVYVKAPMSGKNVQIRRGEKGKKENIASENLTRITVKPEDAEDAAVFVRLVPALNGKMGKEADWMMEYITGPATLYVVGGGMVTSRAGQMHSISDVSFYVRRKGEEAASYIGAYISSGAIGITESAQFRKFAAKYFSDVPAFAKRIEGKEWKVKEAPQMIEEFNKTASSK